MCDERMAQIVDKAVRQAYVFEADSLRITYANQSALQHGGFGAEELHAWTPLELMPELDPDTFRAQLERLRAGTQDPPTFETVHLRRNGDPYPVEVAIRLLDSPQPAFVAYVLDITERRAKEEQLRRLAYYDALTGLPNRVLLLDRLQQAAAQADRTGKLLALMFLDLDRFKVINDTLGHRVGDLVLAAAAQRLAGCVCKSDTVARLGGDEFAVIDANHSDVEGAATLADRIIAAFSRPLAVEARQVFIGTSAGITIYPSDAREVDRLLQNADLAMYRAKEQGGNNYQFYTPAMNVAVHERLSLENDLRRALAQGQFQLHYQPEVDLQTGEIVGVEALLRWRHPERGLLRPEAFLAVAEETGLMVPIGEWVLREACAQNQRWLSAGLPPLLLAVNLSASELRHGNLLDSVAAALKASGLDPKYLELELTENSRGLGANPDGLRRLGVKLAIDDVGTGYSPLTYLRTYPLYKVKIDRSFVQDAATDPNSAALTRGIIALGHSLHLKVVAEGVETGAQMEFLRRSRCDGAQGHYFSPALPAEPFDRLLREVVRSSAGLSFGSASASGAWAFWSRTRRVAA